MEATLGEPDVDGGPRGASELPLRRAEELWAGRGAAAERVPHLAAHERGQRELCARLRPGARVEEADRAEVLYALEVVHGEAGHDDDLEVGRGTTLRRAGHERHERESEHRCPDHPGNSRRGGDRARRRAGARPLRPAARRPARAPLPHRARARRRARVGHVLVRGPLPARRLQPPVLLPGGARRQRPRRARLRGCFGRALRLTGGAGVGGGRALARACVRGRRLRPALHGDVSIRGRARRRSRRAEGAPARAAVDGDRPRRADARALAARLPLSLPGRRRGVPRAASPAGPGRGRTGRGAAGARAVPGRAAPALRGGGRVPLLPGGGAARSRRPLGPLYRAGAASRAGPVSGGRLRALDAGRGDRLPGAVADRRERDAPARDRAAARPPRRRGRLLPAALARGRRGRRRPGLHGRALRGRRAPPRRHALGRGGVLGACGRPPPRALQPGLPRGGRPDGRPLGVVLAAPRRHPARARLVPAARHRTEPAVLRGATRARGLPRLAGQARRPLRSPPRHAARQNRGGAGGRAPALGPGGARRARPRRGGHRLRGAGCRADPHRPWRRPADRHLATTASRARSARPASTGSPSAGRPPGGSSQATSAWKRRRTG